MAAIRILTGSVYGGALLTARRIKQELEPEGHTVTVLENPTLADISDNHDALLVCTSTTGQGEVPANLLPFYLDLREQLPQQSGRPFGVIVRSLVSALPSRFLSTRTPLGTTRSCTSSPSARWTCCHTGSSL